MSVDANTISWPGWETVGLIGRGSFGSVYKIRRDVLGMTEEAALKVISIPQNAGDIDEMYNDGYDDESITSTFQSHLKNIIAEYSLMRKMNGSSNIVNCDDIRYVQHDDGIGWDIFIKMELLTPLAKSLSDDYSEDTVIAIARDMCAALELCRKYDIVHRDIKPQNIFVSPNGDYKLGDFGIAKTVEKTMGGTKIGTYKYMAPEVYNNQPYGTTADIYSLGLVLYWLLNERRMPFMPLPPEKIRVGDEEKARLRRFSGEALPPPMNGSEELKKIILKACAYNPKERYATAAEMLSDLDGAAPVYIPIPQDEEDEPIPVVPENTEKFDNTDATVGLFFRDKIKQEEQARQAEAQRLARERAEAQRRAQEQAEAQRRAQEQAEAERRAREQKEREREAQRLAQEQKAKRKRIALISVLCAVIVILLLLLLHSCGTETPAGTGTPGASAGEKAPSQWSEWTDTLPRSVTAANYLIEEQTLYRSRQLEYTSSTTQDKMTGWEHYDTVQAGGGFGQWSDWSAEKITATDSREVQSMKQYRYRDKEYTTGKSASMDGWTHYDTTYSWGDYGAWSSWSTSSASASDSRQVEKKTQYSYRTKSYTTSDGSGLSGWTLYDITYSYGSWSGWSTTPVSGSDTREVETRQVQIGTRYFLSHYCTGNVPGAEYLSWYSNNSSNEIFNANCVYHSLGWFDSLDQFSADDGGYVYYPNGSKYRCANTCYRFYITNSENVYETQYRYRSVSTTYHYYKWSSWSEYGDSPVSSSNDREVRTRTLYRYRDRTQNATHHFWRWGGWTSWSSSAASESDKRQVESATYYRYRDQVTKTTWFFRRWSEWSEYSTTPLTAGEDLQVETKTQYRYKQKE